MSLTIKHTTTIEVTPCSLAELDALYTATEKAGEHRHTGDWDWAAFITLDNGTVISEPWSITFKDPPENFTACVDYDKVTHVHVEGQAWLRDDQPEDLNMDILIDRITNIRWEQR